MDNTPARPAPSVLWDELEAVDPNPLPTNRDSSGFVEFGGPGWNRVPWFVAADAGDGHVFTGGGHGIDIWQIGANGTLTRTAHTDDRNLLYFEFGEEHTGVPGQDFDVPENVSSITLGAQVGRADIGLAIYDLRNRQQPRVIYQQVGAGAGDIRGWEVHTIQIGGREYAFAATQNTVSGQGGAAIRAYDMTQALQNGNACVDNPAGTTCPGIYKGRVGNRNEAFYIDGADHFIAAAFGAQAGIEIWDVSSITGAFSPVLKLSGLERVSGSLVGTHGISLWRNGTSYFLAVTVDRFITGQGLRKILEIYNVSCITSACGSLGSPLTSIVLNIADGGARFLTDSRSNGTPFLYLGTNNATSGGGQREFLWDVTNPAQPDDISPQQSGAGADCYWCWYYPGNPTGFKWFGSRRGVFVGEYFYRAARGIFDVHRRAGSFPPVADFDWASNEPDGNVYGGPSGIGSQVTFMDRSTGNPTVHSWAFQDAVPGTSAQQNPTGIRFNSPGSKTVSLTVSNQAGNDSDSQIVPVLDPAPAVSSVTPSRTSATVCESVTFTAVATGKSTPQQPLTFSWRVLDAQNVPVAGPTPDDRTFVWTSGPGLIPGNYRGEVTASSPFGPSAVGTSVPISVAGLAPLPSAGSFTPTHDPFTNATVQFHLTGVPGATEWTWNFGDGTIQTFTDRTVGENPVHSYTAVGTYSVTVQVRNCVEGPVTSGPRQVQITQIDPLSGEFSVDLPLDPPPVNAYRAVVNVAFAVEDLSTGDPDFWAYDWDNNGSFETGDLASPQTSHTYTQAGLCHRPRLRVKRGAEEDIFQLSQQICVTGGGGPQPAISVGGPSTGTTGTALTYTASAFNCTPSATGWNWTASGGGTVSGSGAAVSITWATTGTKTVAATNSGCAGATGQRVVTITQSGGGGGGGGGENNLDAVFSFSPTAPQAGQAVSFDGTASAGTPTLFEWEFGDGSEGNGSTVSHTYAAAGTYSA
jgi:PKD repeat protein